MINIKVPFRKQIDHPTIVTKRCGKVIADETTKKAITFLKEANKFRKGY